MKQNFSSVAQSCLTLCDPKDYSMPGLPVHHQLLESTQTQVHWVGVAIQPSHPLSSPSPPFNLSQYQGLLKWISSWHQVAEVLEFQPLLTSPVPHSRKQYLGPKELKLSWSQHRYLRNSILGIEYYYLFSPKQYLLYFLYPGMGNRKCIFKIFLQYINI